MATMIAKRKKVNYLFWAFLLILVCVLSYYMSGLFLMDVTIYNYKEKILEIFQNPLRNYWNVNTVKCIGLGIVAYMLLFGYYLTYGTKNFMYGREFGTAEWENIPEFNKKFADLKQLNKNIILTQNARKAYDCGRTMLNNNMTVIGGAGTGKTAGLIAPNLLQFHGSNIYTDPKGDTLRDFGRVLEDKGNKRVICLNLCDMYQSHGYNPFVYIRQSEDITRLITNLISNTTDMEVNSTADPFWQKAESLYLQAIFSYVWLELKNPQCYYKYTQAPVNEESEIIRLSTYTPEEDDKYGNNEKEFYRTPVYQYTHKGKETIKEHIILKQNFRAVMVLLNEAEVPEGTHAKSSLDLRILVLEDKLHLEGKIPDEHPAVRSYYKCVRGAGDTVRSIIISANARFAPFDNEALLQILDEDELDLESIGTGISREGKKCKETALFCCTPDDDTTFNFVAGLLYTQLFQTLYEAARKHNGKLPIDVGFWLDEFPNIKMPNDFDKILSTCRSRGIYIVIVLQSLAQLKTLYREDRWEGIVGNTDTILYLGGNEASTHKFISEQLGKWTIDKSTSGQTYGSHGNASRNLDVLGRELLTPDEVRKLDNGKCICFVRGCDPIIDNKYYWFQVKDYSYVKKAEKYEDPILWRRQGEFYKKAIKKEDMHIYTEEELDAIQKNGKKVDILYLPFEAFLSEKEIEDITPEENAEYQKAMEELERELKEKETRQAKNETGDYGTLAKILGSDDYAPGIADELYQAISEEGLTLEELQPYLSLSLENFKRIKNLLIQDKKGEA